MISHDWLNLNRDVNAIFRYSSVSPAISRIVVYALRLHGDELVGFDNVGREVVAVDATSVQPNRFAAAAWFGGGPVTKQHDLLTMIDVIPRRAVLAFTIGTEGSQKCHVAGCL